MAGPGECTSRPGQRAEGRGVRPGGYRCVPGWRAGLRKDGLWIRPRSGTRGEGPFALGLAGASGVSEGLSASSGPGAALDTSFSPDASAQ